MKQGSDLINKSIIEYHLPTSGKREGTLETFLTPITPLNPLAGPGAPPSLLKSLPPVMLQHLGPFWSPEAGRSGPQ
jgi:hypothetical protein